MVIDRAKLMSAQDSVVAGLLGEGIKVFYDAEVPYADLKRRVMHVRPLPEEVDERSLLHMRADVDHELGHFGASDADLIASVERPLLKLIFNSIEDGFVERWVSQRWLGCAQNLKESNRLILEQIKATAVDSLDSRRARAVTALQSITFGIDVDKTIEMCGQDIRPLMDEVADLLPALALVQNSAMSLLAAEQLVARWNWAKVRQPAEDSTSDGDEPNNDSMLTGSSRAADHHVELDASEKKREARVAKKIEQEGNVSALRKQEIKQAAFQEGSYLAYTGEDHVGVLVPTPGDKQSTPYFLKQIRRIVGPLRRRLLMEFRGTDVGLIHNQERGLLDRGRLWEVPLGTETIFEQETDRVTHDADVTIVIDASGSMSMSRGVGGETRLYLAAQSACAASMVLDLIGVPHEVVAFTTKHDLGREFTKFGKTRYTRVRPLQHLVIKSADQRWRHAKDNFTALSHWDGCCENIDGESIMWAARRLAARNRRGMKPIMIVFSDGSPASMPENDVVLATHLRRTVERIESAGIATVGVGICTQAVSRFYPRFTVIQQVADLVGTSYAVIRDALRSARRRA